MAWPGALYSGRVIIWHEWEKSGLAWPVDDARESYECWSVWHKLGVVLSGRPFYSLPTSLEIPAHKRAN